MRTRIVAMLGVAVCSTAVPSRSQAPQADPDAAAQLVVLKTSGAELLQRQEKTLKTLQELRGAAEQIKALAKKT